jgi:hypothetical protein
MRPSSEFTMVIRAPSLRKAKAPAAKPANAAKAPERECDFSNFSRFSRRAKPKSKFAAQIAVAVITTINAITAIVTLLAVSTNTMAAAVTITAVVKLATAFGPSGEERTITAHRTSSRGQNRHNCCGPLESGRGRFGRCRDDRATRAHVAYLRSQFEEAWVRYCAGADTAAQPKKIIRLQRR